MTKLSKASLNHCFLFTKTSPSPSAENFTCSWSDQGGLFFCRFQNCVYVKTCVQKWSSPDYRICRLIGCWQNTQWHLLRFSPLEQISQYTYWSCNDRQNFKYNFLREVIRTSRKKSLSTPPKSWKSKGQGWKNWH